MEAILNQSPVLDKMEITDITDKKYNKLEDYMKAENIKFVANRKQLYKLSKLIENYAQKAYQPLLATFETESLYKYVEDRYMELLKNIPKAWIIGGFDNPFMAPKAPPETSEVLTCAGTNVEDMWIVITKGPEGPFGLVAEDLGKDKFRGFFTIDTSIIGKVIQKINDTMRIDIDFAKKEWNLMEY